MFDRSRFLVEAALEVHDFVTKLDFPQGIQRKLVRETLHNRLNEILERESPRLFIGEVRRQGQPNRAILANAVNELMRNEGYSYDQSARCYNRNGPHPRNIIKYF